jgi:hydrogenase expression/formation protein HypE
MDIIPPGKLDQKFMAKLLKKYTTRSENSRVIVGPKVGQDTAIIDMGEKYLVVKSDPITFATDEIGYYVVNINTNDIVTSGAIPKWFQSVILLPETDTSEPMVEKIFADIHSECQKLGIEVIGGHTEVTFGLERPIVIGTLFGEVAKEKLVTTMGGKPGDALLITKGIVIEGAAIIAHEKEKELLEQNFDLKLIEMGKKLLHNPGIGVAKEASLIHSKFHVHAMHDPTEGGLAMGIIELARNSNCGAIVDINKIPFVPGSKELCEHFGLNPLGTITSGTLLIAAPEEIGLQIIDYLAKYNIKVAIIGNLTEKQEEFILITEENKKIALEFSEIDEITKIF